MCEEKFESEYTIHPKDKDKLAICNNCKHLIIKGIIAEHMSSCFFCGKTLKTFSKRVNCITGETIQKEPTMEQCYKWNKFGLCKMFEKKD